MAKGLSRRAFLERSGLAALGAAGVYSLLDGLGAAPARAAIARAALPPEQHLMQGLRVISDNDVLVNVQPVYHQVVTATLKVDRSKKALQEARHELEVALQAIEQQYAPTPSGLGVIVAWGTPYFRKYVPAVGRRKYPDYLPVDRNAGVPALQDSPRFPSDPSNLVLEQNDVCVVFASDSLEHVTQQSQNLFASLEHVFALTSIRKGFVGGGLGGKRSIPKEMAMKARIAGAAQIPESAQLFLGFTSTQRSALGPDRIANFETLPGFTDQWPNGYFRNGTMMHLSHLYEDIDAWYGTNAYPARVWLTTDVGRDGNLLDESVLTLSEGPSDVQSEQLVEQFATDPINGLVGHSASMQPVNRLQAALRDNYGIERGKGTAILQRADFNTLDAPFFWTSRPAVDHRHSNPAAGVHFVSFAPSSDFFRRMRLAMDGRYADGVTLPIPPRSPGWA